MIKHDAGKARWDLVPWTTIAAVVRVLTHGAEEYGANNWITVPDAKSRYFAALHRHLYDYARCRHVDPDTGEHPLAHVICNAMFLLWFELNEGGDAR